MAPRQNSTHADGVVFLDATFGRGGHARALLSRIAPEDRLLAIDRDLDAVTESAELMAEDSRLQVHHARFSELATVLQSEGVALLAGVIMDLGVSSPQLDEAGRGFSFRADGPLDMRMDQSRGESAAEWLNRSDEAEIAAVIRKFGEERYARRIAAAIVRSRPLTTTAELADVVRRAVPGGRGRKDDATRTFQAIRMQVNDELGEIESGIGFAFEHLQPGARLAVISFHSLEDRLVKKIFRQLSRGPELPRNIPVRASQTAAPGRLVGRPIRASAREITENPRARSATLRVLERLGWVAGS